MAGDRTQPQNIRRILQASDAAIDAKLLLTSLIDCWGGPTEFALEIYGEFQAAKKGSLQRQKTLQMFQSLIIYVTNSKQAETIDVKSLDDETLKLLTAELLNRAVENDQLEQQDIDDET